MITDISLVAIAMLVIIIAVLYLMRGPKDF